MKVKKCLILYNNYNREFDYLQIIKRILKNDFNIDARIQSRYPSLNLLRTGITFKPNVILTFPLTALGLSTELHILKFLFNCKIISLRTEGVFNYDNSTEMISVTGIDSYSKFLIDFEVFWGPKPARVIGEKLFETNKISSLDRVKYYGYPKWDIEFKIDDELECLKQQISDNSYQDTLLFVTGFQTSSYDNMQKIIHAGDIPKNNISNIIRTAQLTKTFKSNFENTINSAARINNKTFFIIKIHPLESESDYNFNAQNIKVVQNSQKVYDLLCISDYFFHYGSTSAAEAYLLKKPVYYYYDIPLNEYYTDLKWPSNKKIRLHDLESFISNKEYKTSSEIPPTLIKNVLRENFNYTDGKEYKPSFLIAKLISRDSKPQTIGLCNKFLLKSVINLILKILKHPFK